MEAQERSFRENIAQLQEKMEREKQEILREQEKMLKHKLEVSLVVCGQCRGTILRILGERKDQA